MRSWTPLETVGREMCLRNAQRVTRGACLRQRWVRPPRPRHVAGTLVVQLAAASERRCRELLGRKPPPARWTGSDNACRRQPIARMPGQTLNAKAPSRMPSGEPCDPTPNSDRHAVDSRPFGLYRLPLPLSPACLLPTGTSPIPGATGISAAVPAVSRR